MNSNLSNYILPLITLLGSSLAVEIYKIIRDAIKKHRKSDIEASINKLINEFNQYKTNNDKTLEKISNELTSDTKKLYTMDIELKQTTEAINRNSRGTILSLENQVVIFNALRNNHINGESEKQEKKLNDYYRECAESNLYMRR